VRKPHRPSGGGGGDDGGGEVGGGGAGGGDGGEGQLLAAARSASVLTEVLATCTVLEVPRVSRLVCSRHWSALLLTILKVPSTDASTGTLMLVRAALSLISKYPPTDASTGTLRLVRAAFA